VEVANQIPRLTDGYIFSFKGVDLTLQVDLLVSWWSRDEMRFEDEMR
jgi:hypothetical protein